MDSHQVDDVARLAPVGGGQTVLRCLKNVDIARKAWPLPIDSDAARDIAAGAAPGGEQAQHVGLQLSERHGTVSRCVPPGAGHPCHRAFSAPW